MSSLLYFFLNAMPRRWVHRIANMRGRSQFFKRSTDWIGDLIRSKDCVIQSGLGKGLKFNSGGSAVGFVLGTHDTDVQYAMQNLIKPDSVCYDLGANVGFTAVLAAKCTGNGGRVICFEPLPKNSQQIQINADLNQFAHISVHQVAIGGQDEVAEFQVSHAPTWGRLSTVGSTPEHSETVSVQVRQLDKLVAEQNLPLPNFLKMDIEGAEAGALAGARDTLLKSRPIMIIELHHTYYDVAKALDGLDYVIKPLVYGGQVQELDGEYQILVYPKDDTQTEEFWKHFSTTKRS